MFIVTGCDREERERERERKSVDSHGRFGFFLANW